MSVIYYNFEEGQGYVAFQCRTTFYVCICGGKERIGGFRLKKKNPDCCNSVYSRSIIHWLIEPSANPPRMITAAVV